MTTHLATIKQKDYSKKLKKTSTKEMLVLLENRIRIIGVVANMKQVKFVFLFREAVIEICILQDELIIIILLSHVIYVYADSSFNLFNSYNSQICI
jgi:hypothetical protein